MENLFVAIFRFFDEHRALFRVLLVLVAGLFVWRASTVRLEEDVTRIFPDDERVARLNYVFTKSKLAEKIVLMVSVRDSSDAAAADDLVDYAGKLETEIREQLAPHVKEVRGKADDDLVLPLFETIHAHLPVFFDSADYVAVDSIATAHGTTAALNASYRQLISPAGIVTKKVIVQDPLGFSFLVLRKLQRLQYDDNFELYDDFIVTRDHRHLVMVIQPAYPASDSKGNAVLLEELDRIVDAHKGEYRHLMVSFFGSAVVAAGNAHQLQRDTILTVSLTIILLIIVLLGFFRKKRVPFIMLVPVVFGGLFALTLISFFKPSLSILAVAVGSVILGVAVDYSLHYLVLLRDVRDSSRVLREVVRPLTIGSFTTVAAFLCLRFTSAPVLQDIGLFAGLSLIGAALCSLIILPQLVKASHLPANKGSWFDRMATYSLENRRPLVYAILVLTPVFFYFATQVRFNKDMNKLNFMTDETRASEKRLETINKSSLGSVYVVASGNNIQEALRKNEVSTAALERLRSKGLVQKISSVSSFLVSDSLQQVRLRKWQEFWTPGRLNTVRMAARDEGARLGFAPVLFANLDSLLAHHYTPMSSADMARLRNSFFDDYIIQDTSMTTVITLAAVPTKDRPAVYAALEGTPSQRFDRQMITGLFVEYVNSDFSFIVTVTSVLVFIALLVSLGRIELTLITFIPMFFSWIWILGIMALAGIEFNIVNIMVSTFIFGLGDDYSIFIMDGLQQEYRAGKKVLASVRTSVYLSAFTTICGLGVLIFASHPALKSIAAISIIGIGCVFLMAQTLEPYFFRLLISNRTRDGYTPATMRGFVLTVYTYGFFVGGSFLLTIVGLILKLIPLPAASKRLFFHKLVKGFTKALVYGAFNLKKQILNRTPDTFYRPSVIIANHSSFMDILLTTMLHPKVILLTNKWVWNSPVFGGVVRLADYYPVAEGAEDSIERLKQRTDEGYSVVVFPEGTRSRDGKIHRFHKGAFYIAEALRLPIQPLLIHGADMAIRKGEIYLNNATITLKFLPPIAPDDTRFGMNYSERAKMIGRYFRQEHANLASEQKTPDFYYDRLIQNYIYKGPVLEWYARIKVRLEKNYHTFNQLVPRKATVLDLGCGYGFLDYMLHFISPDRVITAVDYDEEKIETAAHVYMRGEQLQFIYADVTRFEFGKYDVIIISDVLHYLTTGEQDELVNKCLGNLNPGGKLIIRDGNRDLEERHRGTWLTELFSVKLLGFNKSRNALNFISGRQLEAAASAHGLSVTQQDETTYTSNVIFVIVKPENVHEPV